MRLLPVRDLVAHSGVEEDAPAVLELGLELTLQHEQHVTLAAPVIRQVPREYSTIRTVYQQRRRYEESMTLVTDTNSASSCPS
jgi:ABC-type transporter lipoprotein component MlaA